jgi:hypothetical protein
MKKSKKTLAMLAPTLALGAGMIAMAAGSATAAGSSTFEAQLNPINHSAASGTVMISLNGSQATITEHVTGLAATFGGKPYPHVQHIHIGAQGTCPGTSADKNGDGVISTTEGAPFYGGIGATLSTSGDTSPAAGTTLTVAPAGSTINYNRTITLDAKTISALQSGTAVIVVHGDDPATLSKQAQGEKSDLVPSLPLAATSPAACGTLKASQMTAMPGGAAGTGGGSTSGIQDQGLLALGGTLLAAGAVAGGYASRRRTASVR